MLARVSDWPARFDGAVANARYRDFAWGVFDCCLFPCDVVRAITGVDLAAELRGRYCSRLGALRLVEAVTDGGDLEALCDLFAARHGLAERPPAFAGRGDLVLYRPNGVRHPATLSIGIGAGAAILFASDRGLIVRQWADCARAWEV